MANAISYNSLDLQDSTYRTSEIEHVQMPKREINTAKRARRTGESFISGWFGGRKIRIKGHILADTAAGLQTAVDALQAAINSEGANLDIGYGGSTRRYENAVVEAQKIPKKGFHHTFVPYEITFYIPDGVGVATSQTQEGDTAQTGDITESLTIAGSADALPVITITVNSATDFSVLKVRNDTRDEELIIGPSGGGSFSAADVIEIDCENMTVKINSTEVDYTGIFPLWDPGSQDLNLDLTFTAVNYDWDFDYYPRYL